MPNSSPASINASKRYCPEDRSQCSRYDRDSPRSSRTTSVTSFAKELRKAAPLGVTASAKSMAHTFASRSGARPPVRGVEDADESLLSHPFYTIYYLHARSWCGEQEPLTGTGAYDERPVRVV